MRQTLAERAAAFDLSDAEVEDLAERAAGQVRNWSRRLDERRTPDSLARSALRYFARRLHVDFPTREALSHLLNRMGSAAWWRHELRKRLRVVELHEIASGGVHRKASPYVSGKALRRSERNARRIAELMASLEAINLDTGQVMPMDELAARSLANPAQRRMAMMVRIRGIEARAKEQGHEAHFVTITAPSRMHARHSDGQRNERHDGTSPRQAQAHLSGVWRGAMRAAHRQGLRPYGLRTVEPHHDGCPHWHVLVFTPAGDGDAFLRTLRTHALADSPNEPGAAEHRLTSTRIDPSKGSAAGYVAKYVAKSIDGHALDQDDEADQTGSEAARRIVSWARLWGIRQFQFFGLPPITPTRELYRHSGEGFDCAALDQAHQACKANDYAAYLNVLQAHSLALRVDYEDRPSSRYAGELCHAIRGLMARGADLAAPRVIVTRTERWAIQTKATRHDAAADAFPWTRINNCAPPYESTTCADLASRRPMDATGPAPGRRRRPPEPARRPALELA